MLPLYFVWQLFIWLCCWLLQQVAGWLKISELEKSVCFRVSNLSTYRSHRSIWSLLAITDSLYRVDQFLISSHQPAVVNEILSTSTKYNELALVPRSNFDWKKRDTVLLNLVWMSVLHVFPSDQNGGTELICYVTVLPSRFWWTLILSQLGLTNPLWLLTGCCIIKCCVAASGWSCRW